MANMANLIRAVTRVWWVFFFFGGGGEGSTKVQPILEIVWGARAPPPPPPRGYGPTANISYTDPNTSILQDKQSIIYYSHVLSTYQLELKISFKETFSICFNRNI